MLTNRKAWFRFAKELRLFYLCGHKNRVILLKPIRKEYLYIRNSSGMYTTLPFNNEITSVDFFAGRYVVYIFGARKVKISPYFRLEIVHKTTGEMIAIHEFRFKWFGEDGVRCFRFDVPQTAAYAISLHFYEAISAVKSRSFLRGFVVPTNNLEEFRLLIKRQR
jgi:hypothetical protein